MAGRWALGGFGRGKEGLPVWAPLHQLLACQLLWWCNGCFPVRHRAPTSPRPALLQRRPRHSASRRRHLRTVLMRSKSCSAPEPLRNPLRNRCGLLSSGTSSKPLLNLIRNLPGTRSRTLLRNCCGLRILLCNLSKTCSRRCCRN